MPTDIVTNGRAAIARATSSVGQTARAEGQPTAVGFAYNVASRVIFLHDGRFTKRVRLSKCCSTQTSSARGILFQDLHFPDA